MSIGGGSSKQTPKDMTPAAFGALQQPFANVLGQLLGFGTAGAGGSTGGTSGRPGVPGMTPGVGQQVAHPAIRGTGGGTTPSFMDFANTGASSGASGGAGGGNAWSAIGNGSDVLRGIPQYGGPITAPIGANEQSMLDKLMANANGTAPDSYAVSALKQFIDRGLNGNAAIDNPMLQSYIEAAQRPTLEGLTETLTRDLPGRFTSAGQFIQPQGSSAFDRAAAIATRGAANANADIATNISYNQVNDSQNRGLDAAKSLPGVNSTEVDTMIKNLQAQALPRLIQEQGIERGMALFKDRVNALMQTLGITAGVTQPTIAQEGKSSQFSMGLK